MRRHPTNLEILAQNHLAHKRTYYGWPKAQWQVLLCGYIADAVMVGPKIVIEVDGPHHDKRTAYDAHRDSVMRRAGYKVFRINYRDLIRHPGKAFAKLGKYLRENDLLEDPENVREIIIPPSAERRKPTGKVTLRVAPKKEPPLPINRGEKIPLVCKVCGSGFDGYYGSDFCNADCTVTYYHPLSA